MHSQSLALPVIDNITHGDVVLQTDDNSLQVVQKSDKAILDWHNFQLSASENIQYHQPLNATCLNRIDATQGMTLIDGTINANANIYLINQAGILFGINSNLNVGGIIASTLDIANENFLENRIVFHNNNIYSGAIINQGNINIAENGYAALFGNSTVNDGVIKAKHGKVTLATGSTIELIDLYGVENIYFEATNPTKTPGLDFDNEPILDAVLNTGKIINDMGEVYLTGNVVENIFDNLINTSGLIQAKSIEEHNGIVMLYADGPGQIDIAGGIDVSVEQQSYMAGSIIVYGDSVNVAENTLLHADALDNGNGGLILINSENSTSFNGLATARGGNESGDGGFVEISGNDKWLYNEATAKVDTSAKNGVDGKLIFDPKFLLVQKLEGDNYKDGKNNLYKNNKSSTNILTPTSIEEASKFNHIVLQANTDIMFNDDLNLITEGNSLNASAGRSILINNNITTNNADITMVANDTKAKRRHRDTTSDDNPVGNNETVLGNIVMREVSVDAGQGKLDLSINKSSKGPFSSGDIILHNISAQEIVIDAPQRLVTNKLHADISIDISVQEPSAVIGEISGAAELTKKGKGEIVFNTSNTYTGPTILQEGSIKAQHADIIATSETVTINENSCIDMNGFNQNIYNLTGSGKINLNNAELTIQQLNSLTFDGVIEGVGQVIKNGSSILTLSNPQDFSGMLSINKGTIFTTNNDILSSQSLNITSSDAVLDLANTRQSITSLQGTGLIKLGNGELRVKQNINSEFFGTITGAGGLVIDGEHTLTLSGNNLYTGITRINKGIIKAGAYNVFDDSMPLHVEADSTFNLNNYDQALGPISGAGKIELGNAALTVKQEYFSTFAGIISGTGSLNKYGYGTLLLARQNAFTGNTKLMEGTILLGAKNALRGNIFLANDSSAILDINSFDQTFTEIAGGGVEGGNIHLGTATLTIKPSKAKEYSGIISGEGGLTIKGNSILKLSAPNTYEGDTIIKSGIIMATGNYILPRNSKLTLDGEQAIFALNGFNQTVNSISGSAGQIDIANATLSINQAMDGNFAGYITGSGNIVKNNNGTLILSGKNPFAGDILIYGGVLQAGIENAISNVKSIELANTQGVSFNLDVYTQNINNILGGGGNGGNVNLGTAQLIVNTDTTSIFAGSMLGNGGITLNGTAPLILSGANSYTGSTIINNTSLIAGAAFALSDKSKIILANNKDAILDLNSFSQSISSLSGGGDIGGNIKLGNGILTIKQLEAANYAGNINGAGRIVISKHGTDSLSLSGNNTFTGGIELNGAILEVSSDSNLGAIPQDVNSSYIKFAGGTLNIVDSMEIHPNRGLNLDVAGGELNVAYQKEAIYSGDINGIGALHKQSAGTLILSGKNSYTGPTFIEGGKLRLDYLNSIENSSSLHLEDTCIGLELNDFDQKIGNLLGGNESGGNIYLGNATLTINQNINEIYGGVISGQGNLLKDGAATLMLKGENTYTGDTVINNGCLCAGVKNAIANSSSLQITNNGNAKFDLNDFAQTIGTLHGGGDSGGNILLGTATLEILQQDDSSYSGKISGTGGITKYGIGTLTINASNTFRGDVYIRDGAIKAGTENIFPHASAMTIGGSSSSLLLNGFNQVIRNLSGEGKILLDNADLIINQNRKAIYNGEITGLGNIYKGGSATLTLYGNNTFKGNITIHDGSLKAGKPNTLSSNSDIILANVPGANLDLNSNSQEVGSISGGGGSGGDIILGDAQLTIQQKVDSHYAGTIRGLGGITKSGLGTLTFSGDNVYSGPTNVTAGTLRANDINAFSANSPMNISSNAIVDFNNFNQIIGTLSGSGAIELNGANILIQQKNPSVFSGTINGTGNFVLYLGSSDTLSLTGNNGYTGSTSIRSGKLCISSDSNLGLPPSKATANYLNLNGGTLKVIGNVTIDAKRGLMLGNNDGSIEVNANNSLMYAGVITGKGSLTKTGAGVLALGGENIFSGSTILQSGTLQAKARNVISHSTEFVLSGTSATFDMNDFEQSVKTLSGGGSISLGEAELTINQENKATFKGVISGKGGITKNGMATLSLTNLNSYEGNTKINKGTLDAAGIKAIPAKSIVILENDYSARLYIDGYDQIIAGLSGGGSEGGNTSVNNSSLTLQPKIDAHYAGIISGDGVVVIDGTATQNLAGKNTFSGGTNIIQGALKAWSNNILSLDGSISLSSSDNAVFDLNDFEQSVGPIAGGGEIHLGQAKLIINQNSDSTYYGKISDNNGEIVLNGTGTLTLANNNTYTGPTIINSGTLQAGTKNIISNSQSLHFANGSQANFDLNGFSQDIGALSGGGGNGGNIELGNATLSIEQNLDTTYAGVISGTGNIQKTGPMVLNLGNVNAYTGKTTINEGILQAGAVDVISSSNTIAIGDGAVFDLNGYNQTIDTMYGSGGSEVNVTLNGANLDLTNGSGLVIQ